MTLLETGLAQVSGDRRRPAPRRAGGAGLAGLLAASAPPIRKRFTEGTHRRETPAPDARPAAAAARRVRHHPGRPPHRLRPHRDRGLRRGAAERPRPVGRQRQGARRRRRAKVSAVMEAIERWHAERPRIALRFGEPADLAGLGRPVDLDALPRRRAVGAGPLAWAEATDLATGAPALVPFDLVHTCWLAGRARRRRSSPRPTASPPAAIRSRRRCTRLCELIEGDAVTLFERLPPEARAARRIDPATIDDARGRRAPRRARRAAASRWRSGTRPPTSGSPTVLCALTDAQAPRSPAGFGSGCHPDRGVAALRAITEAAQTRAIAIAGTPRRPRPRPLRPGRRRCASAARSRRSAPSGDPRLGGAADGRRATACAPTCARSSPRWPRPAAARSSPSTSRASRGSR